MTTNLPLAKRKQYCANVFRQIRIVHPIILYHTLISDENLLEAISIQNSDNVLISDDTLMHSIDKT